MFTRLRKNQVDRGMPEENITPEQVSMPTWNPGRGAMVEVNIDPSDPLYALFLKASGVVEIDKLNLDSPALRTLKEAGVRISVPLVSQGELIGVLNLSNRLSEQDYSTEDRRLLYTLATQAAPALRVAQLARQQQVEARQRERLEQEMRVARIIQQTLLPKELPTMAGWQVAAHWQPARAVSGDFYDFITFPDGKLGVAVGDVTDKGVPAALVMATTRSILRSALERFSSPGKILAQANDLLCPDIPANMFVTCLYMIIDPAEGKLTFANAGHNLPLQYLHKGAVELHATGMPLGLMPGMHYEEIHARLSPGEGLLLYSDGLVEAHNPKREMFGFPRLRDALADLDADASPSMAGELIPHLLNRLVEFTGPGWEQEDDVTFVAIERSADPASTTLLVYQPGEPHHGNSSQESNSMPNSESWRTLLEFELPSEPGNEILAMETVADAIRELNLPEDRLEKLKTAVAETTMNALEHGNKYREDLSVKIIVRATPSILSVQITDHGGGQQIPEPETPDLEAKLAGLQSPRGWGLFLIKQMVDELHVTTDETHHSVELVFELRGDEA
jgi:serine phosphatase RsbU (regulator of sigma subunit)/anti-sigma regulatory factor (Ser/Thr protein kinase)